MKKLLLLLFLIPNLVMAEESKWKRKETITPAPIEQTTNKYQDWLDANPDKAGTEDYITVQKAAETYNVEPEERTTSVEQERIDAYLVANPHLTPINAPTKTKPTFNVEAAKAAGLSDEEIQKLIAAGPPKQPTISQEESDKKIRNLCAMQAGDAKSDFAAKKMYETCLDQYGVSK
jgi:hypothetical protein